MAWGRHFIGLEKQACSGTPLKGFFLKLEKRAWSGFWH